MIRRLVCAALAGQALGSIAFAADTDVLQEVVVTASLRGATALELPQSVTVLGDEALHAAGLQHLEDVLGMIPDLNWASGTSRPRFYQLRGIGEVEQYQGAPNPSVGFLVDDIDFSGVGMPATLFDTRQVEVLRGPQGTSYGANALAGLISVRTEDPGKRPELNGEATIGNFDTRAAGVAIGDGFAGGDGGWRVVAQQFLSDGFRHNAFLGRNTTNGYDEGTLRGKLHWAPSDALQVDLTLMHVNIDNGYDAWSIDNSRTTYSNQPGRDAQVSDGAALRVVDHIVGVGELRSVTSAAHSRIHYAFDGDWGNDVLWNQLAGVSPYDYFQSDYRLRSTLAQDVRFIADPALALFGRLRWLAGVYALRLTESDQQTFAWSAYDAGPEGGPGVGGSRLASQYTATNLATYGSVDVDLPAQTLLTAGWRVERRVARYVDSADVDTPFPSEVNDMLGGNLSLTHSISDAAHVYATLARGYKGGGFNIGSGILSEQREFSPETLWSLETGVKYGAPDRALAFSADAFYMRRQNMQVYLSEQLDASNPLNYVFYTQNASDGENFGVEAEASRSLGERFAVSGSLSLLRSRYLGVSGVFSGLGLDGRAQPFAPGYKASVALDYRHPSGWFARLDAMTIDSFYYYTSDPQTSSAYHLENVRVGYREGPWTTSLWVRNVFDARYAQNGFYFGLIPPNFPTQAFLQLGDPRQIGVTVSYRLGERVR
jgi:outer membrane receptor protein involved in Fe transport